MIPLGEQIADVYRRMHRVLVKRLGEATPRPWTQLKALRVLAEGGAPTQAALAERLMMDAPSTSRLVARLEADGLLTRGEGDDRRCVRLSVTAAAAAELDATQRCIDELEAHLERYLSEDERRTLQALLDKLLQGFKAEPTGGSSDPCA